jgi:hypothetical protein
MKKYSKSQGNISAIAGVPIKEARRGWSLSSTNRMN